jgi:glyoxylase-like metal-dependent hydrolase (beta-lactamase superfamily II)
VEVPLITYPLESEPQAGDGSAVEVAPGVLWMRMPLGGSLKWINIWAIAEAQGWTIVDTGMLSDQTLESWRALLGGALTDRPVVRVVVTHMHPDHAGMAGWLVDKFQTTLWMSRLEYLTCRLMAADTGREAPPESIAFYRATGWTAEDLDRYRQRFGFFGKAISTLPAAYRRLADGDVVTLGARDWQVVVGRGHSPEHACLYCKELKLLISGDQVLPRISSNVSVYPTEPEADPLRDWLTSLEEVRRRVPDDVLVLPAHNSPFSGLHARIAELIEGHEQGLTRLAELLTEPKRAIDVFGALFARRISPDLLGMATGEALAHLNYLVSERRAIRERDLHGVWWWRRR